MQDWIQIQEEPELLALTYGQIKRLLHVALRADQTGIDKLLTQNDDLMWHYGQQEKPWPDSS